MTTSQNIYQIATGYRLAQASGVLGIAFFVLISFPWIVELPGGATPGQLLMLVCLPIWALAFVSRGEVSFDDRAAFLAVAILLVSVALVACALLSAFFADRPFRVMRTVISFLTAFALFTLFNATMAKNTLQSYIDALCLSLIVVCALTSIAFFEPNLHARIFGGNDRAEGFFKNPNQFGIAISTLFPLVFAQACGRRYRLAWIAGTVFLLIGLMATGSKTNLLLCSMSVTALIILFSFISHSGRKRFLMIGLALLGAAAVLVALWGLLSVLNPRALLLLQRFANEGDTHSLISRADLWQQSIDLFLAHPLLGVGAGQPLPTIAHSHNVLLEFARTLGVPGLMLISTLILLVLWACVDTVIRALRASTADLSARYLCIGAGFGPPAYIAANMTSDSFGPTTIPYFFSVLFVGLGVRRLLATRVM